MVIIPQNILGLPAGRQAFSANWRAGLFAAIFFNSPKGDKKVFFYPERSLRAIPKN
ncbi:MAG: hypothetical protein Q7U59_09745 [Lutibacter sp.]|nr:hypothetical protein [Lutibacter sp.]